MPGIFLPKPWVEYEITEKSIITSNLKPQITVTIQSGAALACDLAITISLCVVFRCRKTGIRSYALLTFTTTILWTNFIRSEQIRCSKHSWCMLLGEACWRRLPQPRTSSALVDHSSSFLLFETLPVPRPSRDLLLYFGDASQRQMCVLLDSPLGKISHVPAVYMNSMLFRQVNEAILYLILVDSHFLLALIHANTFAIRAIKSSTRCH